MIVVDTNIIAYLLLPTHYTAKAERLLEMEPEWAVPLLWRSELRNVLALTMKQGRIGLADALALQQEAESLLDGYEFESVSLEVLNLAAASGATAYDCEFVALARSLELPLVTMDRKLAAAFPADVVLLDRFVGGDQIHEERARYRTGKH